jgi:hypothetical protein
MITFSGKEFVVIQISLFKDCGSMDIYLLKNRAKLSKCSLIFLTFNHSWRFDHHDCGFPLNLYMRGENLLNITIHFIFTLILINNDLLFYETFFDFLLFYLLYLMFIYLYFILRNKILLLLFLYTSQYLFQV